MRPGSLLMVHRASTFTIGNTDDHAHAMNQLSATDTALAALYQAETGRTLEECQADMESETWMTAAQAIEMGYADAEEAVVEPADDPANDDNVVAFNYTLFEHAPERLVALSNAQGWSTRKPRALAVPSAKDVAKRQRATALAIDPNARPALRERDRASKPGEDGNMNPELAAEISTLCINEGVPGLIPSLIAHCAKMEQGPAITHCKARVTDAKAIKTTVATAHKAWPAISESMADEFIAAGTPLAEARSQVFAKVEALQAAGGTTASHHSATETNSGGARALDPKDLDATTIYARRAKARAQMGVND
jgi:hypothetical protein